MKFEPAGGIASLQLTPGSEVYVDMGGIRVQCLYPKELTRFDRVIRVSSDAEVPLIVAKSSSGYVLTSHRLNPDEHPLEADALSDDSEELRIHLPNGGYLCCSGGDEYRWGSQVTIRDAAGQELVTWTTTEWQEEPESVMGAIFAAACAPNLSGVPLRQMVVIEPPPKIAPPVPIQQRDWEKLGEDDPHTRDCGAGVCLNGAERRVMMLVWLAHQVGISPSLGEERYTHLRPAAEKLVERQILYRVRGSEEDGDDPAEFVGYGLRTIAGETPDYETIAKQLVEDAVGRDWNRVL